MASSLEIIHRKAGPNARGLRKNDWFERQRAPMIRTGQLGRKTNFLLLFASFGIGNGSLFLAQSWLLLHGELGLIGLFGTYFAMATLATLLVDWGGLVLLARSTLATKGDEGLSAAFWDLTVVRLLVALLVVAGVLFWVLPSPGGFAEAYLAAAAPAVLVGALNAGGILDGLHRSGATGATTMVPMLLSAAALPFVPDASALHQGYVLGAAYSVGAVLSVGLQHLMVAREGRRLGFSRPTAAGLRRAAFDGGMLSLTLLPGQFLYRGQVAISISLLGAEATGVFVYAKQIVQALSQVPQFARRAEFPYLVGLVQGQARLGEMIRIQWVSLGLSAGLAVLMIALGLGSTVLDDENLAFAGRILAAFGPASFAIGLFSAMVQVFSASGRLVWPATVLLLVVPAGLLLTIPCVMWIGVYGLAVTEFGINVVGFAMMLAAWKSART